MVDGKHVIVGVHIKNRLKDSAEVQQFFTLYGCYISTRIGLHEVQDDFCADSGLVILQMVGDERFTDELVGLLNAFAGVEAKKLVFGEK